MKKKLIHCNSRSSATVSTKRLHCGRVAGKDIYRDFAVIENTCHLVFDTVMNGWFYPKDVCVALANRLMESNAKIPAPISHPRNENGDLVLLASDMSMIITGNVFAFDADWRIEGDRLMSNTYVDMEAAARHPDAQWLVERIHNKQPIDRSTGGMAALVEEDGIGPDGEPYTDALRALDLDHSAILDPDREPGAKNNAEAVGMFTNAQGDSIDVVEVEIAANASTPAMRLPIAPKETNWDGTAAEGRIREYTGSTDAPSSNYRKFFMYFYQANSDQFTAYKLPFADIINGKPHVIPAAISAIQGALSGARGGVDIPDADRQRIQDFVAAYQARIEREQSSVANSDQGGIANIINKIIEVFGFKPKAGYNADGLINNNEADQMKEKIIAALNAAGIKTDGLSDDALFSAFQNMKAPEGKPDTKPDVKPEDEEDKKAMVDNAKLLDAINALAKKVEAVELAANAAAKTEIEAMAEQVADLKIGLTANAAKLLPKAELESILAKNGVIVANSFGGQRQGGSQYEAMPE